MQSFIYSSKFPIRIDDINYGNHLCHTKYISLLHNSRALFLEENNISERNCFGAGLIVLSLKIDYKSECFFNNILEIKFNIEQRNKVAVNFLYKMFNLSTNKLAADAHILMGFLDFEKNKLRSIPEKFLTLLKSKENEKRNY